MSSRKALKQEFKQRKVTMGVFQIRNTTNNKCLIDQSLDIPAKWNRIRTELKFGSHRNPALQEDWNAQEETDFEFSILSELEIKEADGLNLSQELQLLFDMVIDDESETGLVRY